MLLAQFPDGTKVRHPSWGPDEYGVIISNDSTQQNYQIVGSVNYMKDGETGVVGASNDPESLWQDDTWEEFVEEAPEA